MTDRTREHVRGAILAAVVLVNGFAASPLPRNVQRSQYDTPLAREEVARWRSTLASVGIVRTEAELIDASFTWGSGLAEIRRAGMTPFTDLFRLTGTGQSWGLFTYPDTFPHQLVVWTRRGDDAPWELRYAGLDRAHTDDVDVLAYRRIRGVYDAQTSRPTKAWPRVAAWIARRALVADASATHARVGFYRRHSLAPGEARSEEAPVLRHARTYRRDALFSGENP